jgi:hypothetical protein
MYLPAQPHVPLRRTLAKEVRLSWVAQNEDAIPVS